MMLSECCKFVTGLAPVADAFAGASVASDVINMESYQGVTFIVYKGVGTTGTSTITVEACDDVVPTNTSTIPFRYRRQQDTDNITGALTTAAATGFVTTAGSAEIYIIEVDVAELAKVGYGYVRLAAAESANDPVLGGILAILHTPRYARSVLVPAIA